jgi:hypothetical protein
LDVAPADPLRRRRAVRGILIATALLGVLAAVAVAAGTAPADRTFATVSLPTQSLMSVTVPFLGVLLVSELHAPFRAARILAVVGRALGLALLVAAFGVLSCAVATAAFASDAPGGRWPGAAMVALGSLLVQGVAQLVGTALGLLVRRPVLACLATVALPLGLWWLLGAAAVLRPAQAWLTPYPSVQHLLSGQMTGTSWAQWLAMLAIWSVGLNTIAILRATHGRRTNTPEGPTADPTNLRVAYPEA